jgi:hypothetical protein
MPERALLETGARRRRMHGVVRCDILPAGVCILCLHPERSREDS